MKRQILSPESATDDLAVAAGIRMQIANHAATAGAANVEGNRRARAPLIRRTAKPKPYSPSEKAPQSRVGALRSTKCLKTGKGHAEEHAVSFPARLSPRWSKPGLHPEQSDRRQ